LLFPLLDFIYCYLDLEFYFYNYICDKESLWYD